MKILAVIPAHVNHVPDRTVASLMRQTVLPKAILVLPNRGEHGNTISEKISGVLNEGLANVNLNGYDYLLRVDADVVLASDWIETHLAGAPDLCSPSGCLQLVKMAAFRAVMGGRYHPENDDSYTINRFAMLGKKVVRAKDGFKFTGKPRRKVRYFMDRGWMMYRLGYEPVHVLASILWGVGNAFGYFTYGMACLRRPGKLDVAEYVRRKQLARLWRLIL